MNLKAEFFYLNRLNSVYNLRNGMETCIHYHNNGWIKLELKRLSPEQRRTQPQDPPSPKTAQSYKDSPEIKLLNCQGLSTDERLDPFR